MDRAKQTVLLGGLLACAIAVIWGWDRFVTKEVVITPKWTVTVLDEAGRPLPGFEVSAAWEFYGAGNHGGHETKVTDAQGRVIFPARTFRATSAGLAAAKALTFLNVHSSFGPSGSVMISPRGYKFEQVNYSTSKKIYDYPGAKTAWDNGEFATILRFMALDFFDFLAARDWVKVKQLLTNDPGIARLRDARGATPLILLLDEDPAEGRSEAISLVLDAGGSVNDQAADGTTALHNAAKNYNVTDLEFLLSKGADPGLKIHDAIYYTTNGFTPLHFLLSAHGQKNASAAEKIRGIDLLLAHGADIGAKDANGDSPLHLAAVWGDPVIVDALLAHGADPSAKNNTGQSPLESITRLNDTPPVHRVRELLSQAVSAKK